jgi:hypothetical protein
MDLLRVRFDQIGGRLLLGRHAARMDLRFDGKVQVNVFLSLLPIEWVIVIFADFEPAHHGPAAKRDKMMSGAKNG